MFQRYVHPASVDADLSYFDNFTSGQVLFTYSLGSSGASFASDFGNSGQVRVNFGAGAPTRSLLSVNIGSSKAPTGFSSCTASFYDGDSLLCVLPIHGNGIGQHADAVPIPSSATHCYVRVLGVSIVCGQIRVVDREIIPYQPLKG